MTTQERIKADAEKAFPMRDTFHNIQRLGYIAGATAEHNRAQLLVDALELIEANSELPGIKSFATTALEQWKSGKI